MGTLGVRTVFKNIFMKYAIPVASKNWLDCLKLYLTHLLSMIIQYSSQFRLEETYYIDG